jgi:hypothetical protein
VPVNHPECQRAGPARHQSFFSVALEVKASKVDQESVSRIAKKTSVVNGRRSFQLIFNPTHRRSETVLLPGIHLPQSGFVQVRLSDLSKPSASIHRGTTRLHPLTGQQPRQHLQSFHTQLTAVLL